MVGQNVAQVLQGRSLGVRDWGEEILLGYVSSSFTLKKLILKKNSRGGLQFHRKKNEMAYLISGVLKVRFETEEGGLAETFVTAGQAIHFPVGCVHQEIAVTDCEIIEVSTPFLNDRVRVEAEFGEEADFGLPSTSAEEIEEL